jgi:hypothetical protein
MAITDTIFAQVMEVRKHPQCPNMFSVNEVQRLAFDLGFYELVDLIQTDKKAYSAFILTGERGSGNV